MIKRIARLVVINILVFAVTAEALALAVFYYQTGWLFYIDPYKPHYDTIPDARQRQLTTAALHPYFGPTHQPGVPFDVPEELRDGRKKDDGTRRATNNFGFTALFDYPFVKNDDRQFVVGIFGGSVAAWFCEIGTDRLVERLQESPALEGRRIVPLCFGHGGYKQPQQLLLLSYFLSIGQVFDVVLNIDGFNEVALSRLNDERGSDISMPSVMHMSPLANLIDQSSLTPQRVTALARIVASRQRLNSLAERLNSTRLAVVYVVLARLHRAASQEYQAEQARFDELPSPTGSASILRMTPSVRVRPGAELYEDIARNWVRSSILMKEMLAPRGVPYIHVLQPNQYYTTRAFPPAQAAVARLESSPFKLGAERGYPYLEKAAASDEFKRSGVNVVNAVHVFDREPDPVYIDNCCHYTRRGNELLADVAAKAILGVLAGGFNAAGPGSPRE